MSHIELAPRFRVAIYWWIASELARRNRELHLLETYPMDGFYDCLTLVGSVGGRQVHIDLNRHGSIHVPPDHIHFMEDRHVVTNQDAHAAVKDIERIAGLSPEESAPASNGRIITLRLIARVLNSVVNEKVGWDARMISPDGFGWSMSLFDAENQVPGTHPFPAVFRTASEFDTFRMSTGLPDQYEAGRFWALQRNSVVVAIFDAKGYVYTTEARIVLKPLYARMNRNLTRTMVHALGDLLP